MNRSFLYFILLILFVGDFVSCRKKEVNPEDLPKLTIKDINLLSDTISPRGLLTFNLDINNYDLSLKSVNTINIYSTFYLSKDSLISNDDKMFTNNLNLQYLNSSSEAYINVANDTIAVGKWYLISSSKIKSAYAETPTLNKIFHFYVKNYHFDFALKGLNKDSISHVKSINYDLIIDSDIGYSDGELSVTYQVYTDSLNKNSVGSYRYVKEYLTSNSFEYVDTDVGNILNKSYNQGKWLYISVLASYSKYGTTHNIFNHKYKVFRKLDCTITKPFNLSAIADTLSKLDTVSFDACFKIPATFDSGFGIDVMISDPNDYYNRGTVCLQSYSYDSTLTCVKFKGVIPEHIKGGVSYNLTLEMLNQRFSTKVYVRPLVSMVKLKNVSFPYDSVGQGDELTANEILNSYTSKPNKITCKSLFYLSKNDTMISSDDHLLNGNDFSYYRGNVLNLGDNSIDVKLNFGDKQYYKIDTGNYNLLVQYYDVNTSESSYTKFIKVIKVNSGLPQILSIETSTDTLHLSKDSVFVFKINYFSHNMSPSSFVFLYNILNDEYPSICMGLYGQCSYYFMNNSLLSHGLNTINQEFYIRAKDFSNFTPGYYHFNVVPDFYNGSPYRGYSYNSTKKIYLTY